MSIDPNLRTRANRQGLRLVTFGERSRWFSQYGPYALADADTGGLVAYGLDAEAVATELA